MLPKQQHWVPQFYLEYFAACRSKKGLAQVWIFSKDDKASIEPKLVGVNGICKKKHLHSPKIKGQDLRDGALDAKIGDLETAMAIAWNSLASESYALDVPGVKQGLALFMAVLYLRHPENLAIQAELHRTMVEQFDRAPKDADQIPLISTITIKGKQHDFDTSGWREWRQSGTDDHHRTFAAAIEHEAIGLAEGLLKKRWSVIAVDQPGFITSDRCVAVHHRERQICGLMTPGAVILFPLSPTRVLILDDQHLPSDQYITTDDVGSVNFMIWRGAMDFMISSRDVDTVLQEIMVSAERKSCVRQA
jgi:hypothetical protein